VAVSDLDIWRSANQIIIQHGAGVWVYAAKKCREFKAVGDEEGSRFWRRVADAIAEAAAVRVKNRPS
jgi:hypothetical protein